MTAVRRISQNSYRVGVGGFGHRCEYSRGLGGRRDPESERDEAVTHGRQRQAQWYGGANRGLPYDPIVDT